MTKRTMRRCFFAVIVYLMEAAVLVTAATAEVRTFMDDEGREITVTQPFQRIISLYSAQIEILYDLGASDQLIGGQKTGYFPAPAAFLPQYDYNGDPEKIIAAEPDLLLIRPFITRKAPDFVKAIENAGITVVSLYPERFEDFDEYVRHLSILTGKEDMAEEKLAAFHAELDAIAETTADIVEDERQTVFFESTEVDLRSITSDSMPGIAIRLAGGNNAAANAKPISVGSSIAAFGAERILMMADDIDVYISQRGSMNTGGNEHSISIRPGFNAVKAVKDGRIYELNEKLISSPTFRFTVGTREVARYLYPELMDDLTAWQTDQPVNRREMANIIMRILHLPVYTVSSSSYYSEKHQGHVYGMFTDVPWTDTDFNAIESSVMHSLMAGEKDNRTKVERFLPDEPATRDMLARALFMQFNLDKLNRQTRISDLSESANGKMVQAVVDHGLMPLYDDAFKPSAPVSGNEIIVAFKAAITEMQ